MRTAARRIVISAVIVSLLGFSRYVLAQSDLVLGVLEEGRGDYAGQPNTRDIRVLFKKVGNEWQSYPNDCPDQACLKTAATSYPKEVTWTVAFNGRNLGQVTSHTPEKFSRYWRIGQQEITSGTPVPTIGKTSLEFGGFLGTEVHRPLVAVSRPNFHDPDLWKPAVLTPELLTAVRKGFRQQISRICPTLSQHDSDRVAHQYKDRDLRVTKSYKSKPGWILARLQPEKEIDCADAEAGVDMADLWFVVDNKGTTRYLDSGMFLVDAGDYDGDGKSEVLFSVSGYNRGGYRIYYDDFRKTAEFKFSYH